MTPVINVWFAVRIGFEWEGSVGDSGLEDMQAEIHDKLHEIVAGYDRATHQDNVIVEVRRNS